MTCPVCGVVIRQVASATPDLARFQHLLWIHGVLESQLARLQDGQR